MKTFRNLLVIVIMMLLGWTMTKLDGNWPAIVTVVLATIFGFNMLVRTSIRFKPYMLSKWNLFTTKFERSFQIDIPRELLFDKLQEVAPEASFVVRDANREKFEILATAGFSWKSWGENIYIELSDAGEHTQVRFISVSIFQLHTWGKNEHNYTDLLQKLEDSLTV